MELIIVKLQMGMELVRLIVELYFWALILYWMPKLFEAVRLMMLSYARRAGRR
jgi:hypothetical protein